MNRCVAFVAEDALLLVLQAGRTSGSPITIPIWSLRTVHIATHLP